MSKTGKAVAIAFVLGAIVGVAAYIAGFQYGLMP